MNKLNLKWKYFKMLFFYIKTNIKFFLFFLIAVVLIVLLLFVFVCKNNVPISLSELEYKNIDEKIIITQISYFFNFGITGAPMIVIFMLISLFFIAKIFSSEIKNGRISFWLSHSDRRTVFWAKFSFIQIISIVLFLPILIICSIYGKKIIDIWNYDLIIKQLFIFLITIIALNTFFILINNLFTYNTLMFWLISCILLFIILVTSVTSEIYFMDRNDWKIFQYNQYLCISLIYPNLLHSNINSKTINVNGTDMISWGILPVYKKEILIKLLGVQAPLIIAESIISDIVFVRRDFKGL